MKKILLLFIFGMGISFSDCNYINNQDFFIKPFIQSVKEEKLEEKIYCGVWTEKRGFYTLRKEIRIFLDFDYSKLLNIFVYFG